MPWDTDKKAVISAFQKIPLSENDFAQVSLWYYQNELLVPFYFGSSKQWFPLWRFFPLKTWLCKSETINSAVPLDYIVSLNTFLCAAFCVQRELRENRHSFWFGVIQLSSYNRSPCSLITGAPCPSTACREWSQQAYSQLPHVSARQPWHTFASSYDMYLTRYNEISEMIQ